MNYIVSIILGGLLIGVVALLCLFLCVIKPITDEYWKEIRKGFEEKK